MNTMAITRGKLGSPGLGFILVHGASAFGMCHLEPRRTVNSRGFRQGCLLPVCGSLVAEGKCLGGARSVNTEAQASKWD